MQSKTENPAISIIMATHNDGHYLSVALDSIISQTVKDFECIVINDGSTDDTVACLQSYVQKDSRIRLIHHEVPMGLTRSLIQGIAQARGPIIARQDADDWSSPDRLEKQLAVLNQHPTIGCVGSWAGVVDAQGDVQWIRRCSETHDHLYHQLQQGNRLTHGSVMMRQSVYTRVGGYDALFQYAQDYDLWLRIGKVTQLHCIPDVLYYWRSTPHTISSRHSRLQTTLAGFALCRHRYPSIQPIVRECVSAELYGVDQLTQGFIQHQIPVDIRQSVYTILGRFLLGSGDYQTARGYLKSARTRWTLFLWLLAAFPWVIHWLKRLRQWVRKRR